MKHLAFAAVKIKLREDLRVRSRYLLGKCVDRSLKNFTEAATDEDKSDQEWLRSLVVTVADKPTGSWTDEDVAVFELRLSDFVRKFKNLEILQKEIEAKGEGFEAQRITLTRQDGQETATVIWFDHERENQAAQWVDKILQSLPDDIQLRQAIVAKLSERILGSLPQDNVAQIQEEYQTSKHEQKTS